MCIKLAGFQGRNCDLFSGDGGGLFILLQTYCCNSFLPLLLICFYRAYVLLPVNIVQTVRGYNLQSQNTWHCSDFYHLKYQRIVVSREICEDLTASKECSLQLLSCCHNIAHELEMVHLLSISIA